MIVGDYGGDGDIDDNGDYSMLRTTVCTVLNAASAFSHLILTTISSGLINHNSFSFDQWGNWYLSCPLLHSWKSVQTQVSKILEPLHIDYPAFWWLEATVSPRVMSRVRGYVEDPQPWDRQRKDRSEVTSPSPQKRHKQGDAIETRFILRPD